MGKEREEEKKGEKDGQKREREKKVSRSKGSSLAYFCGRSPGI